MNERREAADTMGGIHQPVMVSQVVGLFSRQIAEAHAPVLVDGTLGLGGHSEALLQAIPRLTIVGIDRDESALVIARRRLAPFSGRVRFVHGNYRDFAEHLHTLNIGSVEGVLLDLGLSSLQIDRPERGFSFRASGPLDMRMDQSAGESAADLVNNVSEGELEQIISRYGEERFARRVARAIVAARTTSPVSTTDELAKIVYDAIPRRFHPNRIHPATRTFQALRIAVNEELDNLEGGLDAGFSVLAADGIMAVISFHSLEDRMVKGFFRHKALACTCPPDLPTCMCDKKVEAEILTKRAIFPTEEETEANPRARSSRLRAAKKLEPQE